MTGDQVKLRRAVLRCLRQIPDFSGLSDPAINAFGRCRPLLKWLDESGLALYLWQQFTNHGVLDQINSSLREALDDRVEANRLRTTRMLREFERVNSALLRIGITYVVVKGFGIGTEFCSDPRFRHQCDIDLLVAPESVKSAERELLALGYGIETIEPFGQIALAIRSEHLPSADEDLYVGPHNWHVEIHPRFWERVYGVSLCVGEDWCSHIELTEIEGIRYPRLSLEYRFLNQVLHVFRHISSWLRVSWLYEISYFLERFQDAGDFWEKVMLLTNNDCKVQNACGVACRMVGVAFGTRFPEIVQEKWIAPLKPRQALWIERHAARWMLQDFISADKSGLLLQRDFADADWAWWKFRLDRYARLLKSIVQHDHSEPLFLGKRMRKHLKYLVESLRWNLARSSEFQEIKKTKIRD